jgi:DNA adenine methylase
MKTPITYYGGKQRMIKKILPLIPAHTCFVEPFAGGLAVFFAKPPSNVECINDTNGELINFYKVIKHNFNELQYLLEETLYSRFLYKEAKEIYGNPGKYDTIKRAWAVWVLCNEGYGGKIGHGWGFDRKSNKSVKTILNKINNFTNEYAGRLKNTQIECDNALKIIKNFDSPETFFYIDPPYIGADQGHYKGYTENDFRELLELLAGIKGKFLLSSYSNEILSKYIMNNKWHSLEFKKYLCLSSNLKKTKNKTEILTANYDLNNNEKICNHHIL